VKDFADLISALAALAWPIVVLVIVIWFGSDIRTVLARLRRGKFFGTEIELDELQQKTEAAEAQIPIVAAFSGEGRLEARATVVPAAEDEIEEVLREAARSPRLGLMLLSSKMERAARQRAEEAGLNMRAGSLRNLIQSLVRAEQLPDEAGEALNLFNQVRNRIIHGHDADDDEIARAIDSGTRLLRLLLSRPRPDTQKPDG
jgi:hypothetical protein